MDKIKLQIQLAIDNLRQQWSKLSKRDKILVCILLFVVPMFLYVKLFFFPELDNIQKKNKKKQDLIKKITNLQTKKIFLAKIKKELDKKEKILLKAKAILPTRNEIPELLTSISTKATRSGLKIVLFQPEKEQVKDYYSVIPVELQVEGPFQQIVVFLDEIRRLERIVNTREITFFDPKEENGLWRVRANCRLETYRFLTEKEQKQQEEKKKNAKKK